MFNYITTKTDFLICLLSNFILPEMFFELIFLYNQELQHSPQISFLV